MKALELAPGLAVAAPTTREQEAILSPAVLDLLAGLHRRFEPRRQELLRRRLSVQAALDAGRSLGFLDETREVREGSWSVARPAAALRDRRVELTGPPERKRLINGLNSGAKLFMADFEDALSPTWNNLLQGQLNLQDYSQGNLTYDSPSGEHYRVGRRPATLVVRPRGWHLDEPRLRLDGQPVSASLFDAGLFLLHCGKALRARDHGTFLYLPKMESHLEARLWDDVLSFVEEAIGLPKAAVRTTVLVETLPAAFEMEEILHELRHRSPALNAGRWDYLFSIIKCNRARAGFVLPDRADLSMSAHFLSSYTSLLVQSCHRRGAYAIGGMAAFIPDRHDPERNRLALEKVRQDKLREAREGFDGTWVAHPDLVPVAYEAFDSVLGGRTDQLGKDGPLHRPGASDLLFAQVPSGAVTSTGVRGNVRVSLTYLANWLGGLGAVAIDGLMEDTATAEICRTQIWQWVRQGVCLEDGKTLTAESVRDLVAAEAARLAEPERLPPAARARLDDAVRLLEQVALGPELTPFLTIPGQRLLVGD